MKQPEKWQGEVCPVEVIRNDQVHIPSLVYLVPLHDPRPMIFRDACGLGIEEGVLLSVLHTMCLFQFVCLSFSTHSPTAGKPESGVLVNACMPSAWKAEMGRRALRSALAI